MRTIFSVLLLINLALYLGAETKGELLKGTMISSDASSETLKNAFDGNSETEFTSSLKSNGWVGLELESPNRITKIGWMQKDNDSSKYLLGVFEGANDESFIDAFPLYMIKEEGKTGEMNYIDIDMTYAFKYIRYVGPNGKNSPIASLEFYGYESSTNISKDQEKLYQPTNLPLIIINTENGAEPKDKNSEVNCNIVIVDKGKVDTKKKATIKLRGNSTMRMDKRPYKFVFEDKATILDLPSKSKKWSLLANYVDKTLLRNTLAFKMSELFGMSYSPSCRHVDLVFNGEFRGNYALCDKVEVAKGRIEFPEKEGSNEESANAVNGYLLEVTAQQRDTMKTTKGIPYVIRYPDDSDITAEQREYIETMFNEIEAEGYDGVLDRIDFDSLCNYILIGEFGSDPDIFFSTYMTKSLSDEKLYFGPVWDFDLGFGNDRRIAPNINNETFMLKYGSPAGTMRDFVVKMLNNEELLQHLKDTWKKTTETKMTKKVLLDFIEEQAKNIDESQKLNFKRWDVLDKKIFFQDSAKCTYDGEIKYLKEYISIRFDLIGKVLDKIDTTSINEETKGAASQGGWGGWGGQGGQGGWPGQGGQGGWPNQGGQGGQGGWPNQGGQGGQGGWGNWGGSPTVDQNCLNKENNN